MSTRQVDDPWIRTDGIPISDLPLDGTGHTWEATPSKVVTSSQVEKCAGPPVATMVTAMLAEALSLLEGIPPPSDSPTPWQSRGKPKPQSGSTAPVEAYRRSVPGLGSAPEAQWFCRRSCHEDAAKAGTASWPEFVEHFHRQHAESERDFTPTVLACRTAMEWSGPAATAAAPAAAAAMADITLGGRVYTDVRARLVEMKHKLPAPLQNRVFAVLQVSALAFQNDGGDAGECLVVTTPVRNFANSEFAGLARDKGVTLGMYAAVERIRVLPVGDGGVGGGIEWVMATSSDVKGVMPTSVQNMFIGDEILKDVGFFMTWIAGQRKAS